MLAALIEVSSFGPTLRAGHLPGFFLTSGLDERCHEVEHNRCSQ